MMMNHSHPTCPSLQIGSFSLYYFSIDASNRSLTFLMFVFSNSSTDDKMSSLRNNSIVALCYKFSTKVFYSPVSACFSMELFGTSFSAQCTRNSRSFT